MSARSLKKTITRSTAAVSTLLMAAALTACSNDSDKAANQPTAEERTITELERRGFHDLVLEQSTKEGTMRLYGDLGSCRVRLHKDVDGIYGMIIDQYRVIDPTVALLEQDSVLQPCFGNQAEETS